MPSFRQISLNLVLSLQPTSIPRIILVPPPAMASQPQPLSHLHPHLRSLATRADRARDTVARLTQVLAADPLNDPTRMAMFPWYVPSSSPLLSSD